MEFWKKQAYEMAYNITHDRSISGDLVSHVFILLHSYNIPEDELPKAFYRFAHNQYKWSESEFNKHHKINGTILEISDYIHEEEEDDISEVKELFYQYLEKTPENDEELFCKEIVKMRICGMTYRDIKRETKIEISILFKAVQQFKYDLLNYHYQLEQHRDCKSIADLSPAGY